MSQRPATDVPAIPDSHRNIAGAPNTVALSTLNADGSIQTTAVWVVLDDDGRIRTSLQTNRHKYRNLQRHPHATIFATDPANPYRTLEVRGDVTIGADDDARTGTRHVITSYGVDPESMQEQLDAERVIITITPTRVIASG
jgi:PPOX class probable F420-dependent enzyme